ncbi:MAG: Mrp/NBP35 family ATP-binding protein [Niameybacter sp.]|uniref:Mrp/NBP35 family ATP-binding protein n=1 Tax=Niameybacter sp. TaxID=2033640 RepID=UPI002FCAAEC3
MSSCSSCPSQGSCNKNESSCQVQLNTHGTIKKIIGVMSGKGGVGKSTLSVLLAKTLAANGNKVGIMDADITGPSIPRLLHIKEANVQTEGELIYPVETEEGIRVMSVNLLMEDENQPVIWRGPVIAGAVKQFYQDVVWGDLDYLVIDMPPGTGDVALTTMQSIPMTGVVMISTPQDMVSMIVSKAINMTRKMNVPVIGVIENMSYILCPDCSKKIKMFNQEGMDKFLQEMDVELLGELPMTQTVGNLSVTQATEYEEEVQKVLNNTVEKIIKF